jgi:hypothetical protein
MYRNVISQYIVLFELIRLKGTAAIMTLKTCRNDIPHEVWTDVISYLGKKLFMTYK